jgi:hypothetical protein
MIDIRKLYYDAKAVLFFPAIFACFYVILFYNVYAGDPLRKRKEVRDSKDRMNALHQNDPELYHHVKRILDDEEKRKTQKVLTTLNTSSTIRSIKSDDSDFL